MRGVDLCIILHFLLTTADVLERFQLLAYLFIVIFHNMHDLEWNVTFKVFLDNLWVVRPSTHICPYSSILMIPILGRHRVGQWVRGGLDQALFHPQIQQYERGYLCQVLYDPQIWHSWCAQWGTSTMIEYTSVRIDFNRAFWIRLRMLHAASALFPCRSRVSYCACAFTSSRSQAGLASCCCSCSAWWLVRSKCSFASCCWAVVSQSSRSSRYYHS